MTADSKQINPSVIDNQEKSLPQLNTSENPEILGRIIRRIAHEIRNPLTNISLATEQLFVIAGDNEEMKMLLDMINRNSKRIEEMLKALSSATKPPALTLSKLDVCSMMNEITEEVLVKNKDVKIEKQFSALNSEITADAEKLRSALCHIVLNAIESFEGKEGVIKIVVKNQNDHTEIEISDNGPGINNENLEKIFEPFFSKKEKHQGIGLTYAQNIILSHKGSLKVKSQPNQGTQVSIVIPRHNPQETV